MNSCSDLDDTLVKSRQELQRLVVAPLAQEQGLPDHSLSGMCRDGSLAADLGSSSIVGEVKCCAKGAAYLGLGSNRRGVVLVSAVARRAEIASAGSLHGARLILYTEGWTSKLQISHVK